MTEGVSKDHFPAWLVFNGEIIFYAYGVACAVDGGCGMNEFMLNHLQGLMVILYHDMLALDVGMEPF